MHFNLVSAFSKRNASLDVREDGQLGRSVVEEELELVVDKIEVDGFDVLGAYDVHLFQDGWRRGVLEKHGQDCRNINVGRVSGSRTRKTKKGEASQGATEGFDDLSPSRD